MVEAYALSQLLCAADCFRFRAKTLKRQGSHGGSVLLDECALGLQDTPEPAAQAERWAPPTLSVAAHIIWQLGPLGVVPLEHEQQVRDQVCVVIHLDGLPACLAVADLLVLLAVIDPVPATAYEGPHLRQLNLLQLQEAGVIFQEDVLRRRGGGGA